jgi:hypothetical protein
MQVPGENYAHASGVLHINIEDDLDDHDVRGPYRGPIPGVFRPKLDWQTEPIVGIG